MPRSHATFDRGRASAHRCGTARNPGPRPTPPGREHIRAFLEGTLAAWPDLRLEVAQVVAEDEWVMGRCIATATHTTPVMGVAPTGKQIVTTFWDLHRFDEAGLIVQTWNLMDSLAIMQQLGVVP